MSEFSKRAAKSYLEKAVGSGAAFRPDQWEAIDALVNERKRVFIVQRTGWGKSTVYFIATRALREQGAGPTLIISPLLALMTNQIQDAEQQLGLEAVSINSNNTDEWETAKATVRNGDCDLLLISPERLANPEFQDDIITPLLDEFGMLVVDEAHCISDWGHDFRPDYRRIKGLVEALPADTPVAATTATANDRVVADVTAQLPGMETLRGPLFRESLRLQTVQLDDRPTRLAWLVENLPPTPPAGIIYCLTTTEVDVVSRWLSNHGIDAARYHGRLDGDRRREVETALLENDVDVVVATNALGMGFNKPDLGFVIHFQRPPNLIRYYQEIGRAGRALDEAYAVLLTGPSDDEVAEYFIENAFPTETAFNKVLTTLEETADPLYRYQLLKRLDISAGDLETCLKILRLDGAITRGSEGYDATGASWDYDSERFERVTAQRREELARINDYVATDRCLAKFIDETLDGTLTDACGRCANCTGPAFPETVANPELAEAALSHYREEGGGEISPRKRQPEQNGTYHSITEDDRFEPGRALARYDDPAWGGQIKQAREAHGELEDSLLSAAAGRIQDDWSPTPFPEWVTAIPSQSRPGFVRSHAEQIAERLGLPFKNVVRQTRPTAQQAELANSYRQCWNVQDAYAVSDVPPTPVLLVDDVVGSRWTFTEVARCLRRAGSGPVYPFAFATRRR